MRANVREIFGNGEPASVPGFQAFQRQDVMLGIGTEAWRSCRIETAGDRLLHLQKTWRSRFWRLRRTGGIASQGKSACPLGQRPSANRTFDRPSTAVRANAPVRPSWLQG